MLAKVVMEHRARPAEAMVEGIIGHSPRSSMQAPDTPSRTPEAIRSSRRLRQSHEAVLASLDGQEHAAGAVVVNQRLLALQERRRELARALQHLEGVASAAVGQERPPRTEHTYAREIVEASVREAEALDTTADGSCKAEPSLMLDTRTIEHVQIELALEARDRGINGASDGSNTVASLVDISSPDSSRIEGEIRVDDTAIEPCSFDILVQSLLRASLSDTNMLGVCLGAREDLHGGGMASNEPLVQVSVGDVAKNDFFHPIFDKLNLMSSWNPVTERVGQITLSSDDVSLAELLRAPLHGVGLLRPQDLQVRGRGTICSRNRGAEDLLQLQHARLCAAAALERAHLGASEDGKLEASDRRWRQSVAERSQDQLLPPLALALAASLRQSSVGMCGGNNAEGMVSYDGNKGYSVVESARDQPEPWCVWGGRLGGLGRGCERVCVCVCASVYVLFV